MKRKRTLTKLDILSEIYSKAGNNKFITMYELETETGLSGNEIRAMAEDLKEEILIVEHPEGFQISDNGMHFCKTRWA
jgi:predicted TPR repeat methyltransferase